MADDTQELAGVDRARLLLAQGRELVARAAEELDEATLAETGTVLAALERGRDAARRIRDEIDRAASDLDAGLYAE